MSMNAEEDPHTKRGKPHDPRDQGWLDPVVAQIRDLGFAIVTDVLNRSLIDETRAAMYRTMEAIRREVGDQRLEQAGEIGALRCMPRFDPLFFRFLEIPEALAIIDA